MKITSIPPKLNKKPKEREPIVEILKHFNEKKKELSLEEFSYLYCWDESKIVDYFKTLTKEEDDSKRVEILRYFEDGSKEMALFINYSNWFHKMAKQLKAIEVVINK